MKVTFDEATHIYRFDGVIVPNVTTVLEELKRYIPRDEWAMRRGTYVHQACCLVDKGTLDWGKLSEPLVPYVEAYVKFRKDYPHRILRSEMIVYSTARRFAGTLDRVLKVGDYDDLYDLKTGSPTITDPLQTGAYALAYEEMTGRKIRKRYAVHLKDDGNYKLEPHTGQSDGVVFVSALNVSNWANAHKPGRVM